MRELGRRNKRGLRVVVLINPGSQPTDQGDSAVASIPQARPRARPHPHAHTRAIMTTLPASFPPVDSQSAASSLSSQLRSDEPSTKLVTAIPDTSAMEVMNVADSMRTLP